jgi:adenine-specific DNA-methyltransferase
VRFELAAASTERDNNKAATDNERHFILAAELLAMDGSELIIRFEYRPDADKRKQ